MVEPLLHCSWNYPDIVDKGRLIGVFYTTKNTKRLRRYSQFLKRSTEGI